MWLDTSRVPYVTNTLHYVDHVLSLTKQVLIPIIDSIIVYTDTTCIVIIVLFDVRRVHLSAEKKYLKTLKQLLATILKPITRLSASLDIQQSCNIM